jgi:predicted ribosome quality control (RQC) complex YloA/Tae2 family protein
VSKTLRYDALLVRALANALQERLSGARIHAIRFDAAGRTVRIATGRGTIVWDLRPHAGGLRLAPAGREAGTLAIAPGSRVAGVASVPDERILEVMIDPGVDARARAEAVRIVFELFGAHANALALDAGGTVVAALRRGTSGRPAARGQPYIAPPASRRQGVEQPLDLDSFRSILGGVKAEERQAVLLERVAWISPLNVDAILGNAATGDEENTAAWRRYREVCHGGDAPVRIGAEGGQPYPRPLPGLASEAVPDLLSAFEGAGGEPGGAGGPAAMLTRLAARLESRRRRRDRLRSEMDGAAAEAAALRRGAGLLLSLARPLGRGQTECLLEDPTGGTVRVELDPALDGAANAERLYDRARRRERAGRRIPELLSDVEREISALDDLLRRIREGDESAVAAALAALGSPAPTGSGKAAAARLPYRRYRSRSGLEIRVGRGARANDDLTLHHSRPDDIFLHARDVAGAHVILVWGRRDQNPPEADLRDAAVLAALHSRGRTSGMVPVDWSRRKHVRKPRKAAPGTVLMERGRTLFVEPDPEAEDRLRAQDFQV